MPDYEQELIYTAWPYWECEAEIAKRFYAKVSDEDCWLTTGVSQPFNLGSSI